LIRDFEADGAGTGRQVRIGGIVQEIDSGTARIFGGVLESLGKVGTSAFYNAGTEFANLIALNGIRVRGQKNGRRNSEDLAGIGDRGAVVASAGGCDLFDFAPAEIGG